MSSAVQDQSPAADAHHGPAHPPYLAHHFDTPLQQFDSTKLGLWLFLATEILLFGGLFCAYMIYRALQPEIFMYGHVLLDPAYGVVNTIVLLFSSLTMACGVRAAQLGQRKTLITMLILTLLCGVGFMVIKGIEYSSKISHGILPGQAYNEKEAHAYWLQTIEKRYPQLAGKPADANTSASAASTATAAAAAPASNINDLHAAQRQLFEGGSASVFTARRDPPSSTIVDGKQVPEYATFSQPPRGASTYFSIYYCMTGLHAVHVLVGMGILGYLLIQSFKGAYSPEYFTPVDIGGLYWHLVDLIWIFLFPLLYLFH